MLEKLAKSEEIGPKIGDVKILLQNIREIIHNMHISQKECVKKIKDQQKGKEEKLRPEHERFLPLILPGGFEVWQDDFPWPIIE